MAKEKEHSLLHDAFKFPRRCAVRQAVPQVFSRRLDTGRSAVLSIIREVLPLTDLEQMMLLTATCGNTGWHFMIMRHAKYAPIFPTIRLPLGGAHFHRPQGFTRVRSFLQMTREYLLCRLETPQLSWN